MHVKHELFFQAKLPKALSWTAPPVALAKCRSVTFDHHPSERIRLASKTLREGQHRDSAGSGQPKTIRPRRGQSARPQEPDLFATCAQSPLFENARCSRCARA